MCHDIPGKIGPFSGDYDKKGTGPPAAAGGYRFEKLLQDLFLHCKIYILPDCYIGTLFLYRRKRFG